MPSGAIPTPFASMRNRLFPPWSAEPSVLTNVRISRRAEKFTLDPRTPEWDFNFPDQSRILLAHAFAS